MHQLFETKINDSVGRAIKSWQSWLFTPLLHGIFLKIE